MHPVQKNLSHDIRVNKLGNLTVKLLWKSVFWHCWCWGHQCFSNTSCFICIFFIVCNHKDMMHCNIIIIIFCYFHNFVAFIPIQRLQNDGFVLYLSIHITQFITMCILKSYWMHGFAIFDAFCYQNLIFLKFQDTCVVTYNVIFIVRRKTL